LVARLVPYTTLFRSTPAILTLSGSVHAHDTMPVGGSCDVHNIHFWKPDQLPVICKSLYPRVLQRLHCYFQVALVHIAYGNGFGAGMLEMSSTHSANSDNALSEVVTWGEVAFTQDMARYDGNSSQRQKGSFDKPPSGIF